jgi:hypothetical protein
VDGYAAPGVGQVGGGLLVVGQAGAGDGGHGGGDALVVEGEAGGGEAMLAGPAVHEAKPQGLGQQRPRRRQLAALPGAMPHGRPLGMAAVPTGVHQAGQQEAD